MAGVALLGLMHRGIARLVGILDRGRRIDDRRIDDRAGSEPHLSRWIGAARQV